MTRSLRTLAAALVTALVLALPGCSALDELDKAAALMEPEKAKSTAAAEQGSTTEAGNRERPLQWDKVQTIHSGELDSSIVRCELGGSTMFMRTEDCRARGGRVGEV